MHRCVEHGEISLRTQNYGARWEGIVGGVGGVAGAGGTRVVGGWSHVVQVAWTILVL